jgi:hypothetical protein
MCCLLAFLTTNSLLSPINCLNVLKYRFFVCRPYSYSYREHFSPEGRKDAAKKKVFPLLAQAKI